MMVSTWFVTVAFIAGFAFGLGYGTIRARTFIRREVDRLIERSKE